MVKRKMIDHLGRTTQFSYPPRRIISLVPGITATLYSLQLDDEIVGRTRYCIHPKEAIQGAETIGGTKRIHLDKIRSLKPDLIFAEKEENTKEIVESLEKEFPVYVAEVQTVQDSYKMIGDLGDVTNRKSEAEKLLITIKAGFQSLPTSQGKRIAYVIWKKPYMVVGNNTFIHSLFEMMGFVNAFSSYPGRYPTVTEEDLQKANLEYLFLATEPYPFSESHKAEFHGFIPGIKIKILDGEMFWYGSRMIEAANYFKGVFK